MGTKVALYIPRPWVLDEPTEVSSTSLEVPPGLQVLLVEDDPEVRKIARNFLDAMGCRVTQAASAELALPLLQPAAGLDLLLSDIALGPGMRGTELAMRAAARLPQLRVLLMSGYSAELLEADRDCPPSWELLRKPFTRQELEQAIARALQ